MDEMDALVRRSRSSHGWTAASNSSPATKEERCAARTSTSRSGSRPSKRSAYPISTSTIMPTLKELMARLGHSSVRAARIYQHATRDRDQAIAKALGTFVRDVQNAADKPDSAKKEA